MAKAPVKRAGFKRLCGGELKSHPSSPARPSHPKYSTLAAAASRPTSTHREYLIAEINLFTYKNKNLMFILIIDNC